MSAHTTTSEFNKPVRRPTIAMDMIAPYGVYLSGQLVGEHDTEAKANQHFERLRATHLQPAAAPVARLEGGHE